LTDIVLSIEKKRFIFRNYQLDLKRTSDVVVLKRFWVLIEVFTN